MVGVYDHTSSGPILSPKTQHVAHTRAIVRLFGVHFEHKIRCLVRAGVVQHRKCSAAAFFEARPAARPPPAILAVERRGAAANAPWQPTR
jgi:hypothetical protein